MAKAGPIAIMSGHSTEVYAGEDELRAALPPDIDLVFADTKDVHPTQWKNLFATGKFQVQITDPQSIEGGLPFRVFRMRGVRGAVAERSPAGTGRAFPSRFRSLHGHE